MQFMQMDEREMSYFASYREYAKNEKILSRI